MILKSSRTNSLDETASRLIFSFLEGVNNEGFSLLRCCLAAFKYL
jgi:hypothetical protein